MEERMEQLQERVKALLAAQESPAMTRRSEDRARPRKEQNDSCRAGRSNPGGLGFPKSLWCHGEPGRNGSTDLCIGQSPGRDLTRDYDWRMLMREHILVTEARVGASVTEGSYVVTVVDYERPKRGPGE